MTSFQYQLVGSLSMLPLYLLVTRLLGVVDRQIWAIGFAFTGMAIGEAVHQYRNRQSRDRD